MNQTYTKTSVIVNSNNSLPYAVIAVTPCLNKANTPTTTLLGIQI